jgi:hypothetical protein
VLSNAVLVWNTARMGAFVDEVAAAGRFTHSLFFAWAAPGERPAH